MATDNRSREELLTENKELCFRLKNAEEALHTIRNSELEANLLRLNRLYAVLSATNQAIVHTSDSSSLFREFCRVAVDLGGFRLAWVGLVDNETGLVNLVSSYGETGYLEGIRISVREEPAGLGPTGIAVREGTYCICNDFHNSECTRPWHEKAHAYGLYASASIALKHHNKVIGALTLYAGEKNFFDSSQVELLQQMGDDVSFALDNLDNEARRRRAEQALQEETAERLRTVETLREKEQMLIQQSRQAAMGEMIGNIAHQWRQPLNTVGLLVQELSVCYEVGDFNEEYLDTAINQIMQLIQHMSRTIDDFRNFFRPEKDKVSFEVNRIIDRTLCLVEGNFRAKQIKVEVVADDEPVVTGYPNEFAQVLLNILNNASDAFQERNTVNPHIVVKVFTESEKTVVTIADNAGGIRKDIIDRIFEPYYTTKEQGKGTGVGLFMAKNIIENSMNGSVTVRNAGQGAEFRIEV